MPRKESLLPIPLVLGLVFFSGCEAYAPGPTDPQVTDYSTLRSDCAGSYWLRSHQDLIFLNIESAGPTGSIIGTISDWDGSSQDISGTCVPVEIRKLGNVTFKTQKRTYFGTFARDELSGMVTLDGTLVEEGVARGFDAFTTPGDAFTKITNAAAADRVRSALIGFLWESGFPTRGVPTDMIETGVASPAGDLGAAIERVDHYQVAMEAGFVSHVYHFVPRERRNRLMVFHHGHAHELGGHGGNASIRFLLERGYDVLGFYMPGLGPNSGPATHHVDIAELGLKFFLEPVVVMLNQLTGTCHFEQIAMMGISGGGWTTTVYAALDPRVQLSFPIAGTLPLELRASGYDVGDLEQFEPAFYRIAGYVDLYVLGSMGPGRTQIQILNEFDDCCFPMSETPKYVARVKEALSSAAAGGSFDFRIDAGQRSHTISDKVLREIIEPALTKSW